MEEDTKKRVDYTPITQGLREYIERHPTMMHAVGLTDLLDNIDAIHRALEDANAEMREFCNRLEDAAKKREDVTIFGTDYTALLLDADGVPIHVGDVMKGEKVGGGFGEPFEVVGYIMSNGELEPMDEHKLPRKRKYSHHHHEPTVEDLLREFAQAMAENSDMYVSEAIDADEREAADEEAIERFAKRLQLAEVDE